MTDARESLLTDLRKRLQKREVAGLRRQLEPPSGVDFSSNDYLGLSRHPRIRKLLARYLEEGSVGAPASRLMRGDQPEFRITEESFARFKRAEAALLFPSGYHANLGLLTALLQPGDRVLSDARNHASIIDGLRLTGCTRVIYPHLDMEGLASQLSRPHPHGRTYVVTESLFSAQGDTAPLPELTRLVRQHNALLIVDDAHATGVFGEERGSGLLEAAGVEREVLAATSTGGKALGLSGAFVTGPRILIEHLMNHARSFIYTTAPLPLLAVALNEAVEIVQAEPWRRSRVHASSARLRQRLRERDIPVLDGAGPIVPIPIGDDRRSVEVASAVRSQGYDVRALRPPTVPVGGALLRISVHADHTDVEIDGLSDAIAMTMSSAGVSAAAHEGVSEGTDTAEAS